MVVYEHDMGQIRQPRDEIWDAVPAVKGNDDNREIGMLSARRVEWLSVQCLKPLARVWASRLHQGRADHRLNVVLQLLAQAE